LLSNISFVQLVLFERAGRCHDKVVEAITTHINEGRKRCAVLVTGIPLAGKKIVCQRAAGYADLVPYLHLSDDSDGFLQLAHTIATWFQYIEIDDVQYLANNVLEHLKCSRWTRAHDECIELVDLSLSYGLRSCFLIDRIQFLDDFSLSLIRECLHGRSKLRRNSSRFSEHGSSDFDLSDRTSSEAMEEDGSGKICFLCVHVSLYNWKSAAQIVADITRSHRSLHIPIVTLGEASREELRTLFQDLSDMDMEERWLDAYAEASGYCAGYFIERAAGIRKLSSMEWMEGQQGFSEITPSLKICIPPGRVRMTKMITVRRVSAEVAMRFSQGKYTKDSVCYVLIYPWQTPHEFWLLALRVACRESLCPDSSRFLDPHRSCLSIQYSTVCRLYSRPSPKFSR